MLFSLLPLAAAAGLGSVLANPVPRASGPVSVNFDGRTFVNQGLVGFGRLPSDARDSFNETLGGLGSAIAFESFKPDGNGGGSGVLVMQPDRGHNQGGAATADYRARYHRFKVQLK